MKSVQNLQQRYQNYLKSIRKIKTTIHWWDLYKGHYIKLNLRLQKEIKAAYLRRVFDDEGDVYFEKNGKRAVKISRSIDITTENSVFGPIKSERWVSANNLNLPPIHFCLANNFYCMN
jgi:hypothetical protein